MNVHSLAGANVNELLKRHCGMLGIELNRTKSKTERTKWIKKIRSARVPTVLVVEYVTYRTGTWSVW